MTSRRATNLKKRICRLPSEKFEPLTFGELNEHDRFIFFPFPGNSEKDRGFRIIYHMYIKNTKFQPGVDARKRIDGSPIKIKDYDTPVIKIK